MVESVTKKEKEAISMLDKLNSDPETAHYAADEIVLAVVSQEVKDAYERAVERAGGWWYA